MSSMKLIYATSIVYPSIMANRKQILYTSRYFHYFLKDNFILGGSDIKGNFEFNVVNFGKNTKSFYLSLKYLFFCKKNNITHIYSRECKLMFFIILYNKIFLRNNFVFIFESHEAEFNFFAKIVLKFSDKIICISKGIFDFYAKSGIDSKKMIIAHDAVEIDDFNIKITKDKARSLIGIPKNKKIVLYSGHLYEWKGVQTLADASCFFSDDVLFVFLGGHEYDVNKFKKVNKYKKNILVLGHREHKDVPVYLKAADVLVLPNSGKYEISKRYTSPIKLFEYMASGVPIVASDLPSIREILNKKNAVLVEPDNPKSLAEGIRNILNNEQSFKKRASNALLDVRKYTWENRVKNIINFILND